jgi:hypothetical protein
MPRVILIPTEEQRKRVKWFAAVGIRLADIACYFHVSALTLQKYYREELFRGPLEANAKVGGTLYEMATNGVTPVATIFWQKARAGWSENPDREAQSQAVPDFIVALDKKAA